MGRVITVEQLLKDVLHMFEGNVQDPAVFVNALREFHGTEPAQRGAAANALSEAIIRKRVDLAEVRRLLLDQGEHDLLDSLNRLVDLIEPYIEEGGVEE
jgi:hypothetical protein